MTGGIHRPLPDKRCSRTERPSDEQVTSARDPASSNVDLARHAADDLPVVLVGEGPNLLKPTPLIPAGLVATPIDPAHLVATVARVARDAGGAQSRSALRAD